MNVRKRLFQKIEIDESKPIEGCWLWMASQRQSGVPVIWYKGRMENARRLVYALVVAPLKRGWTVDVGEKCDVRCVNPYHGTKRVNLTTRFGMMTLDALP